MNLLWETVELSVKKRVKNNKKVIKLEKRQQQTKPEAQIPRLNSTIAEFTLGKNKV